VQDWAVAALCFNMFCRGVSTAQIQLECLLPTSDGFLVNFGKSRTTSRCRSSKILQTTQRALRSLSSHSSSSHPLSAIVTSLLFCRCAVTRWHLCSTTRCGCRNSACA